MFVIGVGIMWTGARGFKTSKLGEPIGTSVRDSDGNRIPAKVNRAVVDGWASKEDRQGRILLGLFIAGAAAYFGYRWYWVESARA